MIASDGQEQITFYDNPDNEDVIVRFSAGGKSITSHSKTDSFGRKIFDELQLGTGFVSRQFSYYPGQITEEHKANSKIKSTATTQLVSHIILSDGRTISYEYDAEERITKVTDSIDGTTEYTYDALGQLLTETVNDTAVNTMTYDNYGNILTKNGISYTYDTVWKDLLTGYGNQTISYDAQGNPTSYLGHTLTWEKGRQLKSFDSNTYTYNANGIRTSKTVNGITHTYVLDGTKILREAWGENVLIPLYDNEDTVCGVVYNDMPYYFLKNLQGDIVSIVDRNADTVARYSYDAWGVCTVELDESDVGIANINPFRYRCYYFDSEIGFYYLQSRYYDPLVGRFINADEAFMFELSLNCCGTDLFTYCKNSSLNFNDFTGYWAEKYANFRWTNVGFNLNVQLEFLSRPFCVSYAHDIIRLRGQWHWLSKKYKNMSAIRIAQELWFHALVYYMGSPIKTVLNWLGISWDWLNKKVESARYMEVNNNDDRAWVFSIVWWSAYTIKTLLLRIRGVGFPFAYIHI